MLRYHLLTAAAVLALNIGAASAQEAGGLGIGQGGGIDPAAFNQATLLPQQMMGGPLYQAPADVRAANPARDRRAVHQEAIARVRGDAGFLEGFAGGQPVAPSRQPPPEFLPPVTFIDAPFIINNVGSAVSIDLEQGTMTSDGTDGPQQSGLPVALPSITNIGSAVNIAAGTGNVAQQTITIGR